MENYELQIPNVPLSPTMFLSDQPNADIPFGSIDWMPEQFSLSRSQSGTQKQEAESATRNSQKQIKRRLAGLKAREKKRAQISSYEQNIKNLSLQIESVESQLISEKTKLVEAINASKQSNNQHSFMYTGLEQCVNSEDPDLDKINLLLNMFRYRIGANGKERQANIEYNFKQILNNPFPALHRYLMYTARHSMDMFKEQTDLKRPRPESECSWAAEFYTALKLSLQQKIKIAAKKERIREGSRKTMDFVRKLSNIKKGLNQAGEQTESVMDDLRAMFNPVQCAMFILFGQRHKFREETSLFTSFEDEPTKRVKLHELND